MENKSVVEKFEQSKYLVSQFEEKFSALGLGFQSINKLGKLSLVHKQDYKKFKSDIKFFNSFLENHEGFKSEFWKGVQKGSIKKEDYQAWKKKLSDARVEFLVCCDCAEKWSYNDLMITSEDCADRGKYTVRPAKLKAYKSNEFDVFKSELKTDAEKSTLENDDGRESE